MLCWSEKGQLLALSGVAEWGGGVKMLLMMLQCAMQMASPPYHWSHTRRREHSRDISFVLFTTGFQLLYCHCVFLQYHCIATLLTTELATVML